MKVLGLYAAAIALASASVDILAAQAVHLPPMYRRALPDNAALIRIKITDKAKLSSATTVVISNDQLVLFIPNAGHQIYPLGNSNLAQLANAIRANHPNAVDVVATYPFEPASLLRSTGTPLSLPDTGRVLYAAPNQPEVAIGFGVLFALAEAPNSTDDTRGLLAQSGFQLDLVGTHQFLGPRLPDPAAPPVTKSRLIGPLIKRFASALDEPHLYAQVRLGLNSDQQLNVVSETTPTEGSTPPAANPLTPQFETAVTQADQIALTAQLEFVWPIGGTPVEFSLVPEFGVSWTQLESYRFPAIRTHPDSSTTLSDEFFDPLLRRTVERDLGRIFPLNDKSLTAYFRFTRNGRVSFYAGGGVTRKEIIQRGIMFRRISTTRLVDPRSLSPIYSTPSYTFWRGVFGARLGGLIDLRVDAIGAIGNRDINPISRDASENANRAPRFDSQILRLILVKEFPLGR